MMDEDQYLSERLEDQIDWYDRKSQWNQWWYKRLQVFQITAAASVPFLAGYVTDETAYIKIIVGLLGLLVAVTTSCVTLFKFQENWLEYRATSESLRHEKYLFLTKAEPYNVGDAFQLLVERVETFISKENAKWAQSLMKSGEAAKDQ
jgi:uncharacterized metal-binding protein